MIIKYIILSIVTTIGYVCSAFGFCKDSLLQIIIGAILLGLSPSLFVMVGIDIGREQAMRGYLNGKIEIDTVVVSQKGEILEVDLNTSKVNENEGTDVR